MPPEEPSTLDRRQALLSGYHKLNSDHPFPDWAYALRAPIPFLGARYGAATSAPRILIYASAENIQTQRKKQDPWLRPGNPGDLDRHTIAWKGEQVTEEAHTRIGIAPFEDGPLRAAAALLWRWEGQRQTQLTDAPTDPVTLTESIAVGNFSRFALKLKRGQRHNEDVVKVSHLESSKPYLELDLALLNPTVILVAKSLPKSIASWFALKVRQIDARVI